MNAMTLLAFQALFGGMSPDEDLPKFGELERVERQEVYPWLGIRPTAVYTAFEDGLRIESGWGFGADATVTLDYGTRAFLGFRAGMLAWNTRTDPTPGVPDTSVQVRQYRVGIFGQFPFRFLEVGIGANVGGYRFRRRNHNDTAGYFEFEAMLGVRPSEYVWLGVVGMQTFTVSDFNHTSDHGYTNYSIGPAVELRF